MKARVFFIMTLLLSSVNVKASDAKEASPQAPADAGHGAAPQAGADAKGVPMKGDHYVHNWIKFPSFEALSLDQQEKISVKAQTGRVKVIVFLASWCVPCQQQIVLLKKIEERYRDRFTDFFYVFAHDTELDARGFSSAYKLRGNTLLGSAAVLETFHQPELPTFYVSDRYQWLVMRRVKTEEKDIAELDNFLKLHTAF